MEDKQNLTTKVKSRKFIALMIVLSLGLLLYFLFLSSSNLTPEKITAFDKILDFLVWVFGVYVGGNIGEKVSTGMKKGWGK